MNQPSGPNHSGKDGENIEGHHCETQRCLLVFPDNDGAPSAGRECLFEIASQLPDIVFLVNRDLEITFFNNSAEISFGVTGPGRCDAVRGKNGLCAGDAVEKAFETGSPQRCRMEHCRRLSMPVDMMASPLRDKSGRITECLVIGRELPAFDNSERQRRDMLSMLSHDIKAPIYIIKAYTEILLESSSASDEEYADILNKIKGAAQNTSLLLDDFITLSKFDAGFIEIDPCPVSVYALVSISLNSLGHMVEEASASVQVSIPDELPYVMLDAQRFGRVIANVITNSLRHSHNGVGVSISARVDKERPGAVAIEISDDGPGIPAGELPYVFDRYYGGSRKGRAEGHGLGLAIVKKMTELHGGDVEITSGEGEGTTVVIRLPIARSTP